MYSQNSFYYPQTQAIYQQPGIKGRPVSSFEEARAITIDFDGSTFFFPDLANKRIYTKQINMDGTASLLVYELREQPIEQPKPNLNDYPMEREHMLPAEPYDHREGKAHLSRKGYMESKEMHLGKEKQMKDLEKYMMELTTDITEMIQGSSPEEKQLMQKKIATLAEKVGQVNV